MRNKRLCLSDGRDQQQNKEKDGEEGGDGTGASTVALAPSERCPICLNNLSEEVGFPEGCCHAFCISCILRWSDTSTSCPVDRKPFQTVYKIDPDGACTKIHVVEKKQIENCSCNLCQWCCTKGKIYFRLDVIKKHGDENMNVCTKEGCKNDEITELEFGNHSYDGLCLTGDYMFAPNSDSADINHFNSADMEEESDLCLIQRKREGLKHIGLPTTMERIEGTSSLSVETFVHAPSFLDDYVFTIRPLSVRNKGFSKRTCVHSCAQEGIEKKQAASGKGTKKKTVQSSTRRRSARNSKSDVNQLQNSPKSSNSDNDGPGCNSSSTTTLSTDHSSKPPAKQRKKTPKKAPKTRKRLRSATQTQQEADESKDSESESEQDEKKLKIPDELFDTTQLEMTRSPANSAERINEPVDHSPDLSPMDQSSEEQIPVLSPMQNVESFDKEKSTSPELLDELPFDKANSPPSEIFTNGKGALEKSQSPSTYERGLDVEETTKHLTSDARPSLLAENLPVSEEENVGSPLSVKCTDLFHKESSSSDSESELGVPGKNTVPSAQSADTSDCMEQDNPCGGQVSESQSSSFTRSKSENLPDLEDPIESSKAEESTSLPAVDPEKHSDDERSPSSCASEHPSENPDLPEMLNAESPLQDSSFKSDDGLGDKQVNGVEIGEQEPKLSDTNASVAGESEHGSTTDISVNSTQLLEKSAVEKLCDVGEVQDRLCNDDLQNVPLVGNKAESIPEDSNVVADSKTSENSDVAKELDVKNSQMAYCEDNNDTVAMECDSAGSDHESEQPTKVTETVVAEPASVSTKTEELESTEKKSVPLEEPQKKESRPRRSRFHSPSTTWSPTKNEAKNEAKEKQKSRSRSRSKTRDSPVKRKSRSRSRERDRNPSEQWKGRSRDRRHRRQSRSKSRSRSRSGSRTRNRNRSNTAERSERDSPWREKRSNDNWKSPRGTERYRRNEHEKPDDHFRRNEPEKPDDHFRRNEHEKPEDHFRRNEPEKPSEHFRNDLYDSRDSSEQYSNIKNDNPDWVSDRIKSLDTRGRGGDGWMRGDRRGWRDSRGRGRGENWGRGDNRGRGDFRGRGDHRGRGDIRGRGGNRGRGSPRGGSHWEDNQYNSGDMWNRNVNVDWNSPRGRGNRGRGGFRDEFNYGDQNENSWNRQPFSGNSNTLGQESTRGQESIWGQEHKNYKPKYEETYESPVDRSGWTSASSWAVRKTLPADVQNYYSKRGRNSTGSQQVWPKPDASQDQDQALKDQPQSQPTESAPIPVNIVQPPMNVVQPPMTAPPPPQPVNIYPYSVGVHPPIVSMPHNPYNIHPPLPIHLHPPLPLVQVSAPTSVPQGLPPPPPPPPPSQQVGYIAPQQDGKPQPKIQIQERAAHEVKMAIRPYYQNKDITKDEYKEIVKKAVDKVCHSKSGEVDSAKVANLVKAYVDKYKHSRKKGTDDKF